MDTQTTPHSTPIDPALAAGAIAAGQVPADTRADGHGPAGARIAAALVKAQAGFRAAKKTAANPFFRSKYATLAEVWEAVAPALTDAGIAVIQPISVDAAGGIFVDTALLHISGESLSCRCPVLFKDRDNPQTMGSAITYARRYSLSAMLGVVTEDDDGEAAMGCGKPSRNGAPATPPVAVRLSASALDAIRAKVDACTTADALRALWNEPTVKAASADPAVLALFSARRKAVEATAGATETTTKTTKKD